MKKNRISQVMGAIWIATSLLWAIAGVLGLIYGLRWLENTKLGLDKNLDLMADSLGSIENLVGESTNVISSTYQSLETVSASTADASVAITEMRPLIWKTTKVVTEEIPNALDGVQDSMPSLIETAKSVDETLNWIANFKIVIPIPLTSDYVFDFGVNYSPEVPLDQALEKMSGNLVEVPDDLRAMETDLDNLDTNFLLIRDDLSQLSDDLVLLNESIAEINPKLNEIAVNISDIQVSIVEMQAKLPASFTQAQTIFKMIMGLLLVTQIPSFYLGWILVRGALFSASEQEK
jgi:hypothetical protein